ncbi:hypothetical protein I3760_12G130600 [Carya illinoinensis]|nr:hypothetical protein I3760_12G130600 [Carya illinoinensis]
MTIFRNCLWTKNKKKKQTQAKEQKQHIMKLVKERTLEDCLGALSPDYAYEEDCKNGGKYQVLPQYFNRVYPALAGEDRDCYKSRGSLCRERLLKVEEIGRRSEVGISSSTLISRSRSGKAKKRVNFKLPEEADIIIFYSPHRVF